MEAATAQGARDRSALGVLAIGGGVLLFAQAVAAALTEQSEQYSATTGDLLSDALLGAGLLVTLGGLEALRRSLAPRLGWLAMVGQAAVVVGIAATVAAGREALDAVYIAGTVAWLAGLIGVAVAAIRSRESRWRLAIALPLAALAALALADAGGAVLLGLLWLVLGARLVRP